MMHVSPGTDFIVTQGTLPLADLPAVLTCFCCGKTIATNAEELIHCLSNEWPTCCNDLMRVIEPQPKYDDDDEVPIL